MCPRPNIEDGDGRRVARATWRYGFFGCAPEFTVFSDAPAVAGEENLFGLPVLEQRGAYAWRPSADDPWFATGADVEEDAPGRIVRTVGQAP